jgi:LysM repeat protein
LVAKETISTGSADTERVAAGEDTALPSVEGESLERAEPGSTPGELPASFVVEIPAESLVEPVAMTTIETEDFDPPVQHEDAVAKLADGRWAVDAKSPRAPAPSIADTVLAQPASMGLSNTSVAVPSTVSVEEAPPEAQPQAADVEPTGEPASFVTMAKVQGDAPDETQQAQPHDAHGTLYEVRLGDTLSRIARANGVTPGELAAWNGMLVGDPLYAGRELRLTAPPDDTATGASASMSPEVDGAAGNASGVEIAPEPVELAGSGTLRPSGSEDTKAVEASVARGANLYEVRSGDTLSGISRALDVELTQLTLWNDLRLTDTLHPGQKLRVTKPEEDAMVSATAIQNLDAGPDVSGIEVDTQPGEATEASALDSQLIEASGRGDMPAVVDVLRQGARVDASDDAGNTALIKAAGAGHDSVVGTLLGRGADANLSNAVGETALMAAVWNGQVRVVNTLLRHGVELEAKNSDGWSAIFYGAISGHWGSVRSLIQNGADVDAVTSRGRSPLLAAVWNGHVTVARQLVNAGADVNAEDSEGWTALMAAAYNGEVEAAELLLAHGARVDATANNGEKALTMARQQGNESVVVLLQADNP